MAASRSRLNLAGWTRELTGKPTITVGSVGLDNEFTSSLREGKSAANIGLDAVLELLERREVDLIAVGPPCSSTPHGRRRFATAATPNSSRSPPTR